MFKYRERKYATLMYVLIFRNTQLITTRPMQPCWRLLMNDHLCTVLGDPGAGTAFHESSGKIWAFHKRNAISKNAIIHYSNTNRESNRDGAIS